MVGSDPSGRVSRSRKSSEAGDAILAFANDLAAGFAIYPPAAAPGANARPTNASTVTGSIPYVARTSPVTS